MPLNCAVVGLGWWGRRVIEELADSEVIAVVTAVDPSADARAWAAARGISVYATLDEALVDGGFGGVIITSPHREHAAQIEAALSAGHHVFSEKPFTTDTASAQRVLEMAQRYGRVVGIGHERRFEPPIKDVRDAVASGRLGTPLVLEATFSHDKFLSLPPDNWRLSPVDAPVGPLSATGIHLMDLSIAIFGWPREVWANLNSDVALLANGAALAVGIGFAGGGSALIPAILSTPFAMRLCLYGTHGWVDIRDRTHGAVARRRRAVGHLCPHGSCRARQPRIVGHRGQRRCLLPCFPGGDPRKRDDLLRYHGGGAEWHDSRDPPLKAASPSLDSKGCPRPSMPGPCLLVRSWIAND